MFTKLDFTHTDGDGKILLGLKDENGELIGSCSLTKEQALDAIAELAIAIRDEYGPFNGIKV